MANVMNEFSEKDCKERVARLSPQLREVLKRMAGGLATKQIADEMELSFETVKTYRERVYSRLSVSNLPTATLVASRAGLI